MAVIEQRALRGIDVPRGKPFGEAVGQADLPQHAAVRDVSATDDGVVVEVEYASSSCR